MSTLFLNKIIWGQRYEGQGRFYFNGVDVGRGHHWNFISKALKSSRRSVCVSNLGQIGKVWFAHSLDENNYVMPASFGDTNDGHYNHFLNYMHWEMGLDKKLFRCPSMSNDGVFDPAGHNPGGTNSFTEASYIMNIIQPGKWSGASVSNASKAQGWCNGSENPIHLSQVANFSGKLLIMDTMEKISNSHSGVNRFDRSDFGIIKDKPTGSARWVGTHHSNYFNAVFGDGHVEKMSHSSSGQWAVNEE